jgi:endonuclease YncB( thermonuclease family)
VKSQLVRIFLVVFWLLGTVSTTCARGEEFTGKVVGITDGDTLTILRGSSPTKIRLHGIDCPESGQDYGKRAKAAASNLAFGKVVNVSTRGLDRYGRTVADITLPDGRSLNQEQVHEGLAWWYRRYAPHDETLARLEEEARAAKRGPWSQPHPVPPWEFRAKEKKPLPAGLQTKVIGNRRSYVFHKPGCPNAGTISKANRVVFDSAEAAKQAGYRPGRDCYRQ